MECFSCVTFRSITLTIYLVRFLFSSLKNFVVICFGLVFFPYSITAESFINIMRLKEITAKRRSFDCQTNSPGQYKRNCLEESVKNTDVENVKTIKNKHTSLIFFLHIITLLLLSFFYWTRIKQRLILFRLMLNIYRIESTLHELYLQRY